ncbi:hypothetical protein PT974_08018 [Cladobotryum mycophilum]|uniref:Uncharacterized protein n=1 Tax=Cladobotryum mycophilum TaxID=491253 RepID=A0ABR0SCC4_9HYPO
MGDDAKYLRYFNERYSQRAAQVQNLPVYNLPSSLEDEGFVKEWRHLPLLLNDTAFYQGRAHALAAFSKLFVGTLGRILWEIFGTEPETFIRYVCDSRLTLSNGFVEIYRRKFPNEEMISLAEFETFIDKGVGNCGLYRPELGMFRSLFTAQLQETRSALERSGLIHEWTRDLKSKERDGQFPLERGLCLYIRGTWVRLSQSYIDLAPVSYVSEVKEQVRNCQLILNIEAHDNLVHDDLQDDFYSHTHVPAAVHILFSAAGTGKTKQLFDLLCQRWGFYLLSPNLEPLHHPASTEENVLDPQRIFGSRDTYTYFTNGPKPKNSSSDYGELSEPIFTARFAMLYLFIRRWPCATPRDWLRFQTWCVDHDPFEALYRLLRLGHEMGLGDECHPNVEDDYKSIGHISTAMMHTCWNEIKSTPHSPQYMDGRFYICMDEAQTALKCPRASEILDSIYGSVVTLYATSLVESDESDPPIDPILLFSGTAMDVGKMTSLLEITLKGIFTDDIAPRKWENHCVHHSFPLVSSDSEFWQLYSDHVTGILSEDVEIQTLKNGGIHRLKDGQQQAGKTYPFLSKSGRIMDRSSDILAQGGLIEPLTCIPNWILEPLHVQNMDCILQLLTQLSIAAAVRLGDVECNSPLSIVLDQADISPFLVRVFNYIQSWSPNGTRDVECFIGVHQLIELLAEYSGTTTGQIMEHIVQIFSMHTVSIDAYLERTDQLRNELRKIYIRRLICAYSRRLRGRYRWSTSYIERIAFQHASHPLTNGTLAGIEKWIQQASQDTWDMTITALMRQMNRMKERGQMDLVMDLYRMAFRAEVMSRPSILLHKKSAQLVTEGFAFVKEREDGKLSSILSEPVAIHAIMEHLLSHHGQEDYEQILLESLIHTQDDYEVQSMFGKAVEWFIAGTFHMLLRPPPATSLFSKAKQRHSLLLELSKSYYLHNGQRYELSSLINIGDFVLPGLRIHYGYDGVHNVWEWMKQYRTAGKDSVSTFLFPSKLAGPDLMFILEANNAQPQLGSVGWTQHKKILCAVQIKTGTVNVKKTTDTLRPENWHKTKSGNAPGAEELEHWKDVPFVLISLCTGAKLAQSTLNQWDGAAPGPDRNHFYSFLDETVTKEIWGEDFHKLSITIKNMPLKERS